MVCDLVLLYLLPKREFYKNMKFKYTDTQTQVSFLSVVNILPTVLPALVSLTNHWGAAKSFNGDVSANRYSSSC